LLCNHVDLRASLPKFSTNFAGLLHKLRVPVLLSFVVLVRLFRLEIASGVDHVLLMLDPEHSRAMHFNLDDCFIQSGQPKTIDPLKLPHKIRTGDPKRQPCRRVALDFCDPKILCIDPQFSFKQVLIRSLRFDLEDKTATGPQILFPDCRELIVVL
jgi:hypothetical protein